LDGKPESKFCKIGSGLATKESSARESNPASAKFGSNVRSVIAAGAEIHRAAGGEYKR
jgi:hypothetical protein